MAVQTGYNPTADKYGYNSYTFVTLPGPPGAGAGTELRCSDCTKTNPAAQGTTINPPVKCVWTSAQWDCSGGPIAGRCINVGTVTTNTSFSYAATSCNKVTTTTTGLTYTFSTMGMLPDEQIELDSYITGSVTGPLFAISGGGSIKWLGGTPPVSSTTSGNVDILFLKFDGTNLLETGEAFGVH